MLENSGLSLSQPAARNLLFGIYDATQNLNSPKLNADTFAAIAFLMRSGGKLPNQPVPHFQEPQLFGGQPATLSPEEAPSIPSDWKKPKIFRADSSVPR